MHESTLHECVQISFSKFVCLKQTLQGVNDSFLVGLNDWDLAEDLIDFID